MRNEFLERVMLRRAEEQAAVAFDPPPTGVSYRKLTTGDVAKCRRLLAAGLSQREVAKVLGVSQAAIQRVLRREEP